jgi:hypothetical protein
MLSNVENGSTERLIEIRESLDFLGGFIFPAPVTVPRHINHLKGQVFVQLYGVIEYTIVELVKLSLEHISALDIKIGDLKHSLFGLVLDSEMESLRVSNTKKWDKRGDLSDKLKTNETCSISNLLMPTDGKNFGKNQFRSVWRAFSITEPLFHDVAFQGSLSEIIVYRNKIAHGEYTSSSVGASKTMNDLFKRQNEVSMFCSYLIAVFSDYLTNQKYKA